MLIDPSHKYVPYPRVQLVDRQWPNQTIKKAPIWLSTDLRDGNQALFEPMNLSKKHRLFQELVRVGLKEIEVGFPAGSQIDFDLCRQLIEQDLVPHDVTPMVMTQLRHDLIDRTVESMRGARRVIVHLYNAIAPAWREMVFGLSVEQIEQLVREHVNYLKRRVADFPETEWILQYSPETFCMAELDVSLQMCHAAMDEWLENDTQTMIINLPTTVEVSTANVFADQIEWMHRKLKRRHQVVLSVHPHNDRGTGVACAEQALLAGADRVEGCLFGNGERSGNLDLVTMALNMYTQGIHPGLDFSDILGLALTVEECTAIALHPRHPYAGDLVFTAFSGSHQDAIAKGLKQQKADALWRVPYLPIDPKDIGRTYDGIVRVNSQSGKGGIAYLLKQDYDIQMPRRMQVEFSSIVQKQADSAEAELSSQQLWELFSQTYLHPELSSGIYGYQRHSLFETSSGQEIVLDLKSARGKYRQVKGRGNGPIAATLNALSMQASVMSYEERNLSQGNDAEAIAIIELSVSDLPGSYFGVGIHTNSTTAAILAVLSGLARIKKLH
ncbi:2-isopropylmalate synthase [Psychrobacter faecalis]|uniref:2-isopropylmalate synthase n=1 Tax=Psychrobacter faecalis TaxID=180588 RepID=UPI003FCF83FE